MNRWGGAVLNQKSITLAPAIGPGDEVITPPNSFVASTSAIVQVGARPVFADVRADQNIDPDAVEAAITSRTRAIMPVHLTGRIADMAALSEIGGRHGIAIIEDAAQAMGSKHDGLAAGSLGDIGCFSAHPVKNLNAAGDAGFLTLNDDKLAERLKRLRHHGMSDRDTVVEWGMVSRMDNLQAAILCMRLPKLDAVVAKRRRNAALYRKHLNSGHVFHPPCRTEEFNSFHTFVIQCEARDELQSHLSARGIATAIHYPIPIHLQPAARSLGYREGDLPVAERQARTILSLPVHQYLAIDDVVRVAEAVNDFFG
jgi:dTDP-4-amino-4,6-dideoxygalactose transaminase